MKIPVLFMLIIISFLLFSSCEEEPTPEETRLEGTWIFTFEGDSDNLDCTFTISRQGSSSVNNESVKYLGSGTISGRTHSITLNDNIEIDRIVGEIKLESGAVNDLITLDQCVYNATDNTMSGKYVGHPSGIYSSYTTNNFTAAGP